MLRPESVADDVELLTVADGPRVKVVRSMELTRKPVTGVPRVIGDAVHATVAPPTPSLVGVTDDGDAGSPATGTEAGPLPAPLVAYTENV